MRPFTAAEKRVRARDLEQAKADGLARVRAERDALLAATDAFMQPDSTVSGARLTDAQRSELTSYRDTLRDLPATITDPLAEVTYPPRPSWLP